MHEEQGTQHLIVSALEVLIITGACMRTNDTVQVTQLDK